MDETRESWKTDDIPADVYSREGAARYTGERGERDVQEVLEGLGYEVEYIGGNEMDLIINGRLSVEVKTAFPTNGAHNHGTRWQFMLHKRSRGKPLEEHILILRCQDGIEAGDPVWHFVIPGYLTGLGGLAKIDITSRPDKYRGRWSLFLDAWDVIKTLDALAEKEGWPNPRPPGDIPL